MSALFALLAVVLVPWALGGTLLGMAGFDDERDRLGRFAWDLAAGSLALALLLLGLGWAGPGLGARPLTLALVATWIVWTLWCVLARSEVVRPERSPASPLLLRAAVALALGYALLLLVDGTLVPGLAGDEAMLWGYRARVIASEGGLGAGFVEAMASPGLRHEDYPLASSLLQAWALGLAGAGDTVLLRLPIQLLALALVAALAAALRRHTRPSVAAALLVGFVALPHTHGALASAGAEAPVALGLVLAVDGWLRRREDGRDRWLVLVAVGLGLAMFTKNDAVLFALALAGGFAVAALVTPRDERRPRPGRAALWLLLPVAVVALGAAYNRWAGFQNDLVTGKGSGEGLLARLAAQPLAPATDAEGSYLAVTARFFGDQLLTHPRYDGLVLALALVLFVVLALHLRRGLDAPRAAALGLATAVTASLAGLFLVYLSTPQPLAWHLASSAPRVAWQVIPLAGLALAAAFPRSER